MHLINQLKILYLGLETMSSGYEAVLQRSYNTQVQNIAGKYMFSGMYF